MDHKHTPFTNLAAVASYTANTARKVPGLADLHRMVMLLLAEQALGDAHILVLGAGGGMETGAMAEAQPTWRFTGVDPTCNAGPCAPNAHALCGSCRSDPRHHRSGTRRPVRRRDMPSHAASPQP